jgi:hypothetical protein
MFPLGGRKGLRQEAIAVEAGSADLSVQPINVLPLRLGKGCIIG